MSAPPPYQSPPCQYPSPQNYGGPGYCYPPQPQQQYYPNQPQPIGYGYGQQQPIIQTVGPPQNSSNNSNKCCLWALLGCCFGCCLAECCD
ncbi:hypothetical protein ACH3XW_47925 [Acanthocheilonema viteae]